MDRADAGKPHMGLTTWKGAKVRQGDVTVAKNYLTEEELSALNRIVTMYLDYAEDQAQRGRPMHMREWADRLDAFLSFNDREVLDNPGKVASAVAERLALEENTINSMPSGWLKKPDGRTRNSTRLSAN